MEEKITAKQLIVIAVGCRIILTLIFLPSTIIPPKNQDFWLTSFFFVPVFLFFAAPVYLLWKKHPDKTIIEVSQVLLGKLGVLVGLLYVWYFFDTTTANVIHISLFYNITQMPETPYHFFIISLIVCCTYTVVKGLEVIIRVSEFLFPIFVVILILFFLLLIPRMELNNLLPIMEDGILPIIHGTAISAIYTEEIALLAMLLPHLNMQGKAKSVLIVISVLITFLALLVLLPVLLVLGYKHAAHSLFPYYSVIRTISIGDFLERIESIHLSISLLGAIMKISIFYYLTVLSLAQVLKISDHRPLIIPLGILVIVYSPISGPSIAEYLSSVNYKTFTWYNLFYITIIPSILLIIAHFKKKEESNS